MKHSCINILVFVEKEQDGELVRDHLHNHSVKVETAVIHKVSDEGTSLKEERWDMVIIMPNDTRNILTIVHVFYEQYRFLPVLFIMSRPSKDLPVGELFLLRRRLSELPLLIMRLFFNHSNDNDESISETKKIDKKSEPAYSLWVAGQFFLMSSSVKPAPKEIQYIKYSPLPFYLKTDNGDIRSTLSLLSSTEKWRLLRAFITAIKYKNSVIWSGGCCTKEGKRIELIVDFSVLPATQSISMWQGMIMEKKPHYSLPLTTSLEPLTLEMVREEERERIGQEIHDELGNMLIAARMDLGWLLRQQGLDEKILNRLERIKESIQLTMEAARRISRDLRPGILRDFGLVAALSAHAEDFKDKSGLDVAFSSNVSELTLNEQPALAFFRIQQESLTNIAKHASATTVSIVLEVTDQNIMLSITDDGVGVTDFDLNKPKSSGLKSMIQRIEGCGGTVSFSNVIGGGFCVKVVLPSPG